MNRYTVRFLVVFILIATKAFASADIVTKIEELGKKWGSYSPCQKEFILGYASYKSHNLKEAKRHFLVCDGKYPILQDYITEFLDKIDLGGEEFIYTERGKELDAEIKLIENDLKNQTLSEAVKEELTYKLAKAYFKARRYNEAGVIFERSSKYCKQRLISLEYLATTYARQERYDEAINTHNKKIINEYPKNKEAVSKALFKIAFLHLDSGNYQDAERFFLRLQEMRSSYQKSDVKWYLAWCAYKTGRFQKAYKLFEALEKRGGKNSLQRALYWKAMALEKTGKNPKDVYREIIKKSRFSYYSFLSSKKLGESPFTYKNEDIDDEEDVTETDQTNDVDNGCVVRAIELDHLGISDLVAREIELVARDKKVKKADWWSLIDLAKKNDAWHDVNLIASTRLSRHLKSTSTREAKKVWESIFPKAYEKLVAGYTQRQKLDPFLVFAIMREESTFKPEIMSHAGAIGLMQLMPETAEKFSYIKKAGNFEITSLLVPEKNIEISVRYINFLMSHYNGNIIYAVAAYNAGEEAIDRWIKGNNFEGDEEFVEEIPYKETQDYVRKVMRAYWIYSELYR